MRAEGVMAIALAWWRYQYEDIRNNSSKDYIITVEVEEEPSAGGIRYCVRGWWGRIEASRMQSKIYYEGPRFQAGRVVSRLRAQRLSRGYTLVDAHPNVEVFPPYVTATTTSNIILGAGVGSPAAPVNPSSAIALGVRTGRRKIQLRRNRA
jgi:hypothetical protein